MTRFRLISVLTATLALAGGAAGPTRIVESTRLVVSIVRLDDAPEVRTIERSEPRRPTPDAPISTGAPRSAPGSTAPVDHPQFQRPPPSLA